MKVDFLFPKWIASKINQVYVVTPTEMTKNRSCPSHPVTFTEIFSHFTIKIDPDLWMVSKLLKNCIQICTYVRYCDQVGEKCGRYGHFLAVFWRFLRFSQIQLPVPS